MNYYMRHLLSFAAVVLATLLLPASALAQRCVAPPGTSGIEQYCETIPTDRGDRPTGGDRSAGADQSAPAPLTAQRAGSLQRRLEAAGPDGRALAQTVGLATSRRGGGESRGRPDGSPSTGARGTADRGAHAAEEPPSNPLGAVRSVVASGDRIGGTFASVLILITIVILGSAWVAARGRRRHGGG